MYIDTHSHIYCEAFAPDRDVALRRAVDAGVEQMLLPDIDSQSRQEMLDICDKYPETLLPMIGLHPTSVKENYKEELALVEEALYSRTYYGIGECGLDFYWDTTFRREQTDVFIHHLSLAQEMRLPVVIHSRKSIKEIFEVLKKHPGTGGVFHCFPGDITDALTAKDMGYYIGIGGVVTFKNSQLQEVVKATGLENIVLETDAPYLTPEPFRGQRNESAYLPVIAQKIAQLLNVSPQEVEEITTRNAINLFKLNRQKAPNSPTLSA